MEQEHPEPKKKKSEQTLTGHDQIGDAPYSIMDHSCAADTVQAGRRLKNRAYSMKYSIFYIYDNFYTNWTNQLAFFREEWAGESPGITSNGCGEGPGAVG